MSEAQSDVRTKKTSSYFSVREINFIAGTITAAIPDNTLFIVQINCFVCLRVDRCVLEQNVNGLEEARGLVYVAHPNGGKEQLVRIDVVEFALDCDLEGQVVADGLDDNVQGVGDASGDEKGPCYFEEDIRGVFDFDKAVDACAIEKVGQRFFEASL